MVNIGSFGSAKAEVTGETHTFEFYGETFEISPTVGVMPLLTFAHAAMSGLDTSEVEGMAAMYDMLRDCLSPVDWQRFKKVATDNRADGEVMLEVCRAVYGVVSGKDSSTPQTSTNGQSKTSRKSKSTVSK